MKTKISASTNVEYITLSDLSKLLDISYHRLFLWQDKYNFLPSYRIDKVKGSRFKKTEALHIINEVITKQKRFTRLEAIKEDLMLDDNIKQMFVDAEKAENVYHLKQLGRWQY